MQVSGASARMLESKYEQIKHAKRGEAVLFSYRSEQLAYWKRTQIARDCSNAAIILPSLGMRGHSTYEWGPLDRQTLIP